MKDCFILDKEQVAFVTVSGHRVFIKDKKGYTRYSILRASGELSDCFDTKKYGYTVLGKATEGKNFFMCEMEEPQFYA